MTILTHKDDFRILIALFTNCKVQLSLNSTSRPDTVTQCLHLIYHFQSVTALDKSSALLQMQLAPSCCSCFIIPILPPAAFLCDFCSHSPTDAI